MVCSMVSCGQNRREPISSGSLRQREWWTLAPLSFIAPPLPAGWSGVAYLEFSSLSLSKAAQQASLHLVDIHHIEDSTKEPRGSTEFSNFWSEQSLLLHQGKRIWVKQGTFPIHISGFHFCLRSYQRLMLFIFLLSLLLYIFSFKKVKGKLGGSFSPAKKRKMLSHFHPSLPQRQCSKEGSCQQMLW